MKVFLTGGTGFLGKALFYNLPYSFFQYKRGENVTEKLNFFDPDVIIHSAGEIYNEDLMYESNVKLTISILDYVKRNSSKVKLIYFGSSSEYGKKQNPMKETDFCDPQTLYAATKSTGTLLCQAYARSYGCDACIIRPFSVYGNYEPAHRLIPTLYAKIGSGQTIDLIQGTHDFIYILDFIDLVKTVITSPKEITKGDIINAGTGTCYTNLEVADTFASILDKPALYKSINKFKDVDSPLWVCDPHHAKAKYNFEAKYTLLDGLKSYIQFLTS